MTTCADCQAALSAYCDGEAGHLEAAIRAHLDGCDVCARMLDAFEEFSARMNAVEQPATLVEDIRRRLRRRRTLVPKLAAVAVLAAALLWSLVLAAVAREEPRRLSDSALSKGEERVLYGKPPTGDEWMDMILRGGSR